ncbi:MAG: helix-turn-helix domain-containing protein [Methylococcaceae bacterium]
MSNFKDTYALWMSRLDAFDCTIHIAPQENAYELLPQKHFHAHPEVFLQISGTTNYSFGQSNQRLHANEIMIIPSGIPHGEIAEESTKPFKNLVIADHFKNLSQHFAIKSEHGNHPSIQIIEHLLKPTASPLNAIIKQAIQMNNSGHVVQKLLSAYLLCISELGQDVGAQQWESKNDLIQHCLLYVDENYNRSNCNVKSIAKGIGCSPSHLSSKFSKQMNIGLNKYLINKRIDEAKKMLSMSDFNVSQTAYACGFEDISYFVQLFKKHTGLTPKKYSEKYLLARTDQ